MLELKNIHKEYPAGDGKVQALRGVSLQFRASEFVAILGPSGCGKTTMLNIIGGLDKYTSGDLVINGRSTRDYKDRDWDAYRNHSIGFVFQSYNLIPHQSVLQNVELALTLSGVKKAERRRRAIEALKAVGLGDQLRKKPAQMSGGQMQRVAIARALVNNPDIILADEPTGALDTETSVQVMEILKEVAKDRLVIMVTHNPDLADQYATRTIRMLDGQVTGDSDPIGEEELAALRSQDREKLDSQGKKRVRKPSMSLWTAFGLSLKNLISKKGRTILTSFAGSIGIIGIALIYAVSQGMTTYIDNLQEDTLSSYPLTIQATEMNMGSLMATFIGKALSGEPHENDAVYEKTMVYDLVNALGEMEETTNDLRPFKVYLDAEIANPDSELRQAINGVQYTYAAPLLVYTQNVDGDVLQADSQILMQELMLEFMGMDMSAMMEISSTYGMDPASMSSLMPGSSMSASVVLWQEMLTGKDGEMINPLLMKQYDLIYGSWPNDYNEVVVVVDENNEIADMTLYAMGLKPKSEIEALANAAFNQSGVETSDECWTYQEICGLTFRVVLPANCYTYDEATGTYIDLRDTQAGLRYLYDNGLDLKIVGIIRPNEEAVSGMLSGTICYTAALTEYIINAAHDAPSVQAQMANPAIDVFTGLPFRETTGDMTQEQKSADFVTYVNGLTEEEKAAAYVTIMATPTSEQIDQIVQEQLAAMTREDMENLMLQALTTQMNVDPDTVMGYVASMTDDQLRELFAQMMVEQVAAQYEQQVRAQMGQMDPADLAMALMISIPATTPEEMAAKAAIYDAQIGSMTDEQVDALVEQTLAGMTRAEMEAMVLPAITAQMGIPAEMAAPMLARMTDDQLRNQIAAGMAEQIRAQAAQAAAMTDAEKCAALEANVPGAPFTVQQMAAYHDVVLHFSESTYEENLITLGCVDLDNPASINIYASSFEDKDIIEAAITAYNEGRDELEQIQYTDYVGLMMSSVTSIINAITYVLIAFVAISLIVSSIMIGVITLISVQERTKEIGILRAIGASKKNVSSMFTAETVIIGFTAGTLGVIVTLLLCIPINAIIHALTGLPNLSAYLPWQVGAVLVGVSVVLTLGAGVIPSRSAARKDPVEALRSE